MAETLDKWAAQIRAGEIRAVSRAITAIENRDAAAHELLQLLFPSTGQAYVIGVTGAAGSGKSTLVDRLASWYREHGRTVGIIAVDPTSPYTGGAVLGDRIRMQRHAGDAGIFIRSMATRGAMGGLASATADVALLLDAAGKADRPDRNGRAWDRMKSTSRDSRIARWCWWCRGWATTCRT